MAPHKVYTFAELEHFDVLSTLVWVVDLERGARWWVNLACLPLWNTTSREELLARTIEPPSETSRIRLEALRRRFEQGQRSIDRWTIYPDGAAPFAAECRSSGIYIAERRGGPGRLAMLIEGRLLGPEEQDPLERRSVEALRYLGELVSFYSETGEAVMRNPAAVRLLGDVRPDDRFAGDFVDPAQAADARARLAAREPFRGDTCIRTLAGERWFDTEARPVLDPVTGKPGVLVTQRDIAERRAHLAALEHSHRLLAEQAEALRTLSAPVIRVGDGVLALPLIGALDGERLDAALTTLLARTGGERVVRVVLDLTGAAALDDAVAAGLLRTIRVLRLQGLAVAVSGIRPELAQAIVAAGLDLGGVPCFQSLEHALRRG
jgi:anti-anti-sigma regulatory factor